MKKKANLIGLLFSLVVIGYVLVELDWQAVTQTFARLNPRWLVAAAGMYGVNYVFRTRRFQVLLDLETLPFARIWGVTNLYGMYLYLLPGKSGELSYPLLLRSRLNIPLPHSAATLIAARFYDFAAIAIFLPFALLTFWAQIGFWIRVAGLAFVFVVLLSGLLGLWFLSDPARIDSLQKIDFQSRPVLARTWQAVVRLVASLRSIVQRGQHWRLWLLTIAIWVCVQATYYFLVRGLGESLTFFQMIMISIIMLPMELIPIQGFAYLGTHEIGWVAAFALFGYSEATALNIAVSSHVVMLFFVLLLGTFGALLLRVKVRQAYSG
ncbi:MAG: flippase-like domain-containing protein [Anaerolineales bacterium]|nr:flippase-like domain-containing protein [Anaerolineales bacterium]